MHFWHYITKEEAKRGLWRHNGLFGVFVSGISAQLLLDWHLLQTLKLGHVRMYVLEYGPFCISVRILLQLRTQVAIILNPIAEVKRNQFKG